MTTDDLIAALGAPFELWEHEYRKQGRGDETAMYLTYVGIEHAIARFNKVLGSRWSWTVLDYRLVGSAEKPAAIVHGRISFAADGTAHHRDGLGAAQWQSAADDLDKIIKSAMAEAFKKASHQFGMAGYLWDKGLADQIAMALLKEQGRPWMARSAPKRPRTGNPAAAILTRVQGGPQPRVVKAAAGRPASEASLADETWQDAFASLKSYVRSLAPEAGPGQWTETISDLVDGRFHTRSPRRVPAAELAEFARDLQEGARVESKTATSPPARVRAGVNPAGPATSE